MLILILASYSVVNPGKIDHNYVIVSTISAMTTPY